MDKTYTITKNGAFFAELPRGSRHHATLAVLADIERDAVTRDENGILTAKAANGDTYQILDAQRFVVLRRKDGEFRKLAIVADDEITANLWKSYFAAALNNDGAEVFAVRVVRDRVVEDGTKNAADLIAWHKKMAAAYIEGVKAAQLKKTLALVEGCNNLEKATAIALVGATFDMEKPAATEEKPADPATPAEEPKPVEVAGNEEPPKPVEEPVVLEGPNA